MKDIYTSDEISAVIDNNVIVDLFELGRIDILFGVFIRVIIPKIIYENEIQEKAKQDIDIYI